MIGPRTKAYTAKKDREQDRKISKLTKIVNTRELKFQDISALSTVPSYTGSVTNLFAPAEGDSDIARAGDEIYIERIDFRLNAGMTGAGSNQLRVILYRDKSFGLSTYPDRILDTNYLSTANAAQSPYEEDYLDNREIIYDKTFLLDSVTKAQMQLKVSKKLRRKVQFVANTTTVSSGQIKLLMVTDTAAPNLAVDYVSRVWFSDL